jgi:hypothetical protein
MNYMPIRILVFWIIILPAFLVVQTLAASQPITLDGAWRFQLDRENRGVNERWFDRVLSSTIQLPGSLPAQSIGDDVSVDTKWMGDIVDRSWFTAPEYERYRKPGNVKIPFWLQPDKYYAGVAWYQRDIIIPPEWKAKRIVLTLERPHWETHVWLDGKEIGKNNSLSTPHEYDLGMDVSPGKHQLTVRVDNGLVIDIGVNSHSITDHTQGNWNGIVGRIELSATNPVWIDDLQAFPHLLTRSVTVSGKLGNSTANIGQGKVNLEVLLASKGITTRILSKDVEVVWDRTGGVFRTELQFDGSVQLWDEFNPSIYHLAASLNGDIRSIAFGFREIAAIGTQFLLNEKRVFFRGTLECCIFPLTGHPPTDVDSWKNIISVAKSYGLNLMRFHSWCPLEAAFVAADELGFYFHVEVASWANQSTTLGDGKPVDDWIYAETDRILKAYGNHPSFLLMPYGNEPAGRNSNAYLAKWVNHFKGKDPRRLYTSGSGWPQLPENQFHVTPDPRIQGWGQGLKSRINNKPPETNTDYRNYIQSRTVPVISHEIGQWCVYPNFDEIKKYTGYLRAKNFEIFRDVLNQHHTGDQAHAFLMASGKLQTLCYKEEIESALRTPGMGGFELLDLHDFPGQGTALVGVLDPFWESKGYVTGKEYSRFCNSTVVLARLEKRVFMTIERLTAKIEIAHFGPEPMENAVAVWKIVQDDGKIVAEGKLPQKTIPIDNGISLGEVNVDLANLSSPSRYKLIVGLRDTPFENDWDVWVYPSKVNIQPTKDILIVDELDDHALATLQAGGKILLSISPDRVKGDKLGKVALGFSTIFWNTAWTGRQAPHTLGILCDPKDPMFNDFPTDYYTNWHWWYLLSRAGAMILDDMPADLRPSVQIVDDWVTNRKLGLVFEARIGRGKLLVCSIDLKDSVDENPVTRQMLHSILDYMASDNFNPRVAVDVDHVRNLMKEPTIMKKLGAKVVGFDSEVATLEAACAIDGDPSTFWHTPWEGTVTEFPHQITIEFKASVRMRGFSALPRQDNNQNGWIKEYEFYASANRRDWRIPIAKGIFSRSAGLNSVMFDKPIEARYVRLVALSGYSDGPWASLAELEVVE